MLEGIASAPNAGKRRGWAFAQMRHCPEPYTLPSPPKKQKPAAESFRRGPSFFLRQRSGDE